MNETQTPHSLSTIDDLRPCPWNPRTITEDSIRGLGRSLQEFGDLSGIVWNQRSGHLVTGHQRMEALRRKHGAALRLEPEPPRVIAPDGSVFSVRVVDLDDATEKAANLTANHLALQGKFTDGVDDVLADVMNLMPDLGDALRLYEIKPEELPEDGEQKGGNDGPEIPEMELQPFEHYDYIVVLARTTQDWEWLVNRFGLKKMNGSPVPGKKKIGLGRAVEATRLIAMLEGQGGRS